MIDVSKAEAIPGWMFRAELEWLAARAQEHQVIVEFGSYVGRSTRALADHCAGVVYAVDDWYGPRDVELSAVERTQVLQNFMANMKGAKARVYPVSVDHLSLIHWVYLSPTMVFIDGAHEYEPIKRDIRFWTKWAAPGALICGHDWGLNGVMRAVNEAFPDAKIAPGTTIWYTKKA